MRKSFLAPTALALALLGTACAAPGGGLVYNAEYESQFSAPGQFPLGGTQAVEVAGTPPGGLTPEAFVGLLRAPGWYQPTRFALDPAPDRRNGVRFVAAFGTDANVGLCREARPGGDPRLLAMALCNGDTIVSRASLRFGSGGSLGADVDALMRGLLPPPRPDDSGPCFRRTGC